MLPMFKILFVLLSVWHSYYDPVSHLLFQCFPDALLSHFLKEV